MTFSFVNLKKIKGICVKEDLGCTDLGTAMLCRGLFVSLNFTAVKTT
jgi:hypothetical protein